MALKIHTFYGHRIVIYKEKMYEVEINILSFRRHYTLIGHKAEISSAQFNFDCSLIVTGSMDKTCKIWDKGIKLIFHMI